MKYSAKARPPGWRAQGRDDDQVVGANEQSGWECSADSAHFEPVGLN